MPKPDIKGLEKLAVYLRTVPNKEFSMGDWRLDSPCGTTACIAGHAAVLFPHRFELKLTGSINNEYKDYSFSHRASRENGSKGFAVGFKISENDAEQLTVRNVIFKRTPKQAARAVTQLVKKLKLEAGRK